MTKGFGPLLPGFVHLQWADHDALEPAITDKTVAILIEPVQGEGGIVPLPDQCLKGLRDLCDEKGILLILDEVQCGVGRTGKLFAHEWAGISPDIMMVAKGLGGGFPIGAVLATEEAASGMTLLWIRALDLHFLGLVSRERDQTVEETGNRARLRKFYEREGITPPSWFTATT